MQKHLFLTHPELLHHGNREHPENASRLEAILEAFEASPYKQYLDLSLNRQATANELSQAHDLAYVKHIQSFNGKEAILDYETILSPRSVTAALLAAGIGLELVERVIGERILNGFALVRPPGHHAPSNAAMGFCIFNNIAIAAKKALSKGIKRILILDWDVHHGNGTQEIFYEDDRVLFIDLHQENLFPINSGLLNERGTGKGFGFTLNIPLPKECRDADYLYAFEKIVRPRVLDYRPELILVSAGFDAHESDPLGNMNLTTEGYGKLCTKVKSLANEHCSGKLVLFLEGGYNPFFLAKNVMECINVLASDTPIEIPSDEMQSASIEVKNLVDQIYESNVRRST